MFIMVNVNKILYMKPLHYNPPFRHEHLPHPGNASVRSYMVINAGLHHGKNQIVIQLARKHLL